MIRGGGERRKEGRKRCRGLRGIFKPSCRHETCRYDVITKRQEGRGERCFGPLSPLLSLFLGESLQPPSILGVVIEKGSRRAGEDDRDSTISR